jgi:hypothetical protein
MVPLGELIGSNKSGNGRYALLSQNNIKYEINGWVTITQKI